MVNRTDASLQHLVNQLRANPYDGEDTTRNVAMAEQPLADLESWRKQSLLEARAQLLYQRTCEGIDSASDKRDLCIPCQNVSILPREDDETDLTHFVLARLMGLASVINSERINLADSLKEVSRGGNGHVNLEEPLYTAWGYGLLDDQKKGVRCLIKTWNRDLWTQHFLTDLERRKDAKERWESAVQEPGFPKELVVTIVLEHAPLPQKRDNSSFEQFCYSCLDALHTKLTNRQLKLCNLLMSPVQERNHLVRRVVERISEVWKKPLSPEERQRLEQVVAHWMIKSFQERYLTIVDEKAKTNVQKKRNALFLESEESILQPGIQNYSAVQAKNLVENGFVPCVPLPLLSNEELRVEVRSADQDRRWLERAAYWMIMDTLQPFRRDCRVDVSNAQLFTYRAMVRFESQSVVPKLSCTSHFQDCLSACFEQFKCLAERDVRKEYMQNKEAFLKEVVKEFIAGYLAINDNHHVSSKERGVREQFFQSKETLPQCELEERSLNLQHQLREVLDRAEGER